VRVLIVDDHADTADAMQILLARAGYDVRVAYSGAEAISVAGQFRPDLAILDILLSDMNGYDLAPRLRAVTGEHGLRLIALSCFDEVARKPISGTELQRMLRRFGPQ